MKQKVRLMIILAVEFVAIALMLVMIFFAGKKMYTVTFDLNGGTLLSGDTVQRVTQGHRATPPTVTKDGCYFLQWSGSYRQVTHDITVRAIWEYETTQGLEYSDSQNSNYCEIVGCYKELAGDVYIGAYYDNKKVLGIREGAFQDCDAITSIYLLEGILAIEDEAFAGCTSLKSIEMPSTLLSLGKNAFKNCTSLEKIVLPSTLNAIGDGAFSGCSALKEIVLPESVAKLGSGVFDQADMIVNIIVTEENKPLGWAEDWCINEPTVVWGYKESDGEDKTEE